jgi:hypothetical protein
MYLFGLMLVQIHALVSMFYFLISFPTKQGLSVFRTVLKIKFTFVDIINFEKIMDLRKSLFVMLRTIRKVPTKLHLSFFHFKIQLGKDKRDIKNNKLIIDNMFE